MNVKRQLCLLSLTIPAACLWGQNAQLGGRIQDQSDAIVENAAVTVLNEETGVQRTAVSNSQGQYLVVSLPPSRYKVTVEARGFQTKTRSGLVLEVGQNAALDFTLQIGATQQTVHVESATSPINAANASVSTVISRDFVANLPLNGRSFHTLVELAPGTVMVSTNEQSRGQFAVNGQRNDANYFTVDGVSANLGVGSSQTMGQGGAGSTVGATALGGTNGLVSIDALQEFRVLTSTYSPEYGRTPGGQVAVVTRGGTNQFHGTAFDYFRNDKLDAADWFSNRSGLPKSASRQNDFGGVFGGPVLKDRTFFFFSYEALRLRQPATVVQDVPTLSLRQTAPAAVRPYLNLFPLPTRPDTINAQGRPTGYAQGVFAVSSPTTLNAASIRVDHSFGSRFQLFGRFDTAPSLADNRGGSLSVNSIIRFNSNLSTFTTGLVTVVSPRMTNDLRFNVSWSEGFRHILWDDFGGATTLPDSAIFPAGYSGEDSIFGFRLANGVLANVSYGNNSKNLTRQFNVVDSYSIVKGSHQVKFGMDWRRLRIRTRNARFQYQPSFNDTGTLTATPAAGTVLSGIGSATLARNEQAGLFFNSWSFFAQDVWKLNAKTTLTYGFRWEVNPPPKPESLYIFAFKNVETPSQLDVAPKGTPLYQTTYGNFAPRVGVAYQFNSSPKWTAVLRTGAGLFYDTAFGRLSNYLTTPPFSSFVTPANIPIPVPFSQALITIPTAPPLTSFTGVDPNLKLPKTWQWNVSIEQQLGESQSLTVSYVGAKGSDLFVGEQFQNLNANFLNITIIGGNKSKSVYNALQAQYQRRFSRSFQAIASYTWSHSIDTASNDISNFMHAPDYYPNQNRANSDFDIRHLFTAAFVYQIPTPKLAGPAGRAILGGWGIDPMLRARTATPIDIVATRSIPQNFSTRLNYISGQPLYLYDPILPGGRRFNPAAWTLPSGFVQGTFGRNVVRGLSYRQADVSVHRTFRLSERIAMQFRSDFFNLTNHPNFSNPVGTYNTGTTFGVPTAMLGKGINSASGGGFNALYQIGSPRSIQLSLKLLF